MLKYKQFSEMLIKGIARGEFRVGEKLPPIRKLAAKYAVSPPTVHQAVRWLASLGIVEPRIGDGTYVLRSKPVHEPSAPVLKKGEIRVYHIYPFDSLEERSVGLARMMQGIENEACGFGLKLKSVELPEDAEAQPDFIISDVSSARPAGIIISSLGGSENTRKVVTCMQNKGIPLAITYHGSALDFPDVPTVTVDNVNAGMMAAEYLLGKNALPAAVFGFMPGIPYGQRLICRGAEVLFEDFGHAESIFVPNCIQAASPVAGYRHVKKTLEEKPETKGFIFAHNDLAEGGIEALLESRWEPGKDVHVVAMPYYREVAVRLHPGVKWISFCHERIGRAVVRAIAEQESKKTPASRIRVSPEFV